jgi:hypothetical protein
MARDVTNKRSFIPSTEMAVPYGTRDLLCAEFVTISSSVAGLLPTIFLGLLPIRPHCSIQYNKTFATTPYLC